MLADRIEGKWIDAFCEAAAQCASLTAPYELGLTNAAFNALRKWLLRGLPEEG